MELVRFSTHGVPPEARELAVQEGYAAMARIDIDRLGEAPLVAEGSMLLLPDVCIGEFSHSPCRIRRTAAHIAGTNDDWTFSIMTGGSVTVEAKGAGSTVFRGGDLSGLPNDRPFHACVHRSVTSLTLTIPRGVLKSAAIDPERALKNRPGPGVDTETRVLAGYMQMLLRNAGDCRSRLKSLAATHLHDLAILVLGGTRDIAEVAQQRGLRAARLEALKADILANVTSPDLSLEWLAARQGISPQYVRSLLYSDGITFTGFVLNQRLRHAHSLLTNPRLGRRTVSAIAFDSGFGDLSWFNQAFRRRYGMTPSDVRAAAKEQA